MINRSISDSRLSITRRPQTDRYLIARIVDGAVAPLELDNRTTLLVQQETAVNPEAERCETVSYTYRLERDDAWVVRWEFLRNRPKPDYDYPLAHLHVNTTTPECPTKAFSDLHLPTRRVPLELILWHTIVEWGVAGRDGWREILTESIEGFEERQTVR